MKSLVLKSFERGNFSQGTLAEEGIENARSFGQALSALYPGQLVGYFSAQAMICQRTASEVSHSMGTPTDPEIFEALGRRGEYVHYLQGVGRHLPDDIDVAVCVTNTQVMERYRHYMGDVNTDTSLRDDHGAQIHQFPNARWVG